MDDFEAKEMSLCRNCGEICDPHPWKETYCSLRCRTEYEAYSEQAEDYADELRFD